MKFLWVILVVMLGAPAWGSYCAGLFNGIPSSLSLHEKQAQKVLDSTIALKIRMLDKVASRASNTAVDVTPARFPSWLVKRHRILEKAVLLSRSAYASQANLKVVRKDLQKELQRQIEQMERYEERIIQRKLTADWMRLQLAVIEKAEVGSTIQLPIAIRNGKYEFLPIPLTSEKQRAKEISNIQNSVKLLTSSHLTWLEHISQAGLIQSLRVYLAEYKLAEAAGELAKDQLATMQTLERLLVWSPELTPPQGYFRLRSAMSLVTGQTLPIYLGYRIHSLQVNQTPVQIDSALRYENIFSSELRDSDKSRISSNYDKNVRQIGKPTFVQRHRRGLQWATATVALLLSATAINWTYMPSLYDQARHGMNMETIGESTSPQQFRERLDLLLSKKFKVEVRDDRPIISFRHRHYEDLIDNMERSARLYRDHQETLPPNLRIPLPRFFIPQSVEDIRTSRNMTEFNDRMNQLLVENYLGAQLVNGKLHTEPDFQFRSEVEQLIQALKPEHILEP